MRELTIDEPDVVSGGEFAPGGFGFFITAYDMPSRGGGHFYGDGHSHSGGGHFYGDGHSHSGGGHFYGDGHVHFDFSSIASATADFLTQYPDAFVSAGFGVFNLNAGAFYSTPTGSGVYVGVGSNGPSFTFGFASDASGYLTGASTHAQYYIGYGHASSASAFTVGAPGASYTYGVTAREMASQFYNAFGAAVATPSYNMLGRMYDPE